MCARSHHHHNSRTHPHSFLFHIAWTLGLLLLTGTFLASLNRFPARNRSSPTETAASGVVLA